MELIISNYNFDVQTGSINCIMGMQINEQEFLNIRKDNNHLLNIGTIIQPPINQVIYQNVKSNLSYVVKKNYQDNKKLLDSLKLVGLNSNCLNSKINDLSDSELYKVVLASCLISNPNIIILDNPNRNLDASNKKKLIQIIRTIKKRYKKTIIIFSNDSDFVHHIAEHVIITSNNKIVLKGDKYTVFDNENVLTQCNIDLPKIIKFEKLVLLKKGKNIGYRDNINDLLKDIYYFK